jgi:hypothetical protein
VSATDIRFFEPDKHLTVYLTPATLRGIAEALENGSSWQTDVDDLLIPGIRGAIEVLSIHDARVQPPPGT